MLDMTTLKFHAAVTDEEIAAADAPGPFIRMTLGAETFEFDRRRWEQIRAAVDKLADLLCPKT